MESIEGRRLHGLAAQAREKGESLESLNLDDEALLTYQSDDDKLGFAESLAERAIALGHEAEKSNNPFFEKSWLIYARNTTKTAVEVAELSGDKTALAIPYLRLGRAHEHLGEIHEAINAYRNAVDAITNNPPTTHNRAAVVADFKNHLACAEYKAGDKSALQKAEEGLKDFDQVEVISDEQFGEQNKKLEFNQEVSYNFNVWLSGAHMRLAEAIKDDEPQKAKEHLDQALEIIDSDSRLTIRRNQWEKLAQEFN
jgi:tetratricopeptide (TPR) repeat protein